MTILHDALVQMALEINDQASIKAPEDLDRIFNEIGLDSLDAMSLMLAVTEKYSVQITDAESDTIQTLNELAAVVLKEQSDGGQES